MAFHTYTTPSNWIVLRPPRNARSGFVFDGDLIGGKVRLLFDYTSGRFLDEFARGDSTSGMASGATRNTLHPLNRANASNQWAGFPVGSWGVIDGKGYCSAANSAGRVHVTTTQTDAAVTAQLTLGSNAGLIMRRLNDNNYWRISLVASTGNVVVAKTVASTPSIVATYAAGVAAAGSYEIAATVTGDNWEIFLDGVSLGTFTDSALNTASHHGLSAVSDTTTRFDRFEINATANHAATSYEVYNKASPPQLLASGVLDGTEEYIEIDDAVHVQANGLGPCGGYRVYLYGPDRADDQFNDSYGCLSYVRMKADANFPDNAPMGVAATNSDSDEIARSVAGLGAWRYSILDDATAEAASTAGFVAAAERLQTYYRDHEHADRPRHTIMLFAGGTANLTAGKVTTWVNALKHVVDVWEPYNEPTLSASPYDVNPAGVQSYIDNELVPFYNEVKAADPNAIVLTGPPVEASGSAHHTWLRKLCEMTSVLDPVPFDGISTHVYNSWDCIADARAYMAQMQALLTDYGLEGKSLWQTEQGTMGDGYAGLVLHNGGGLQAQMDYVQLAFDQEILGMPMEQSVRWYDRKHGFASYPSYWLLDNEGPTYTACTMRTMSAELYDKPFSSELDFGDYESMFIGGVWVNDAGDKVIGVRADADDLLDVRFTVTGAASLTMVDPWGNTDTLPVTGSGYVSVPCGKLPTWLRVPVGATATLVASDWSATNVATTATASTTGSATNIDRVNNGLVLGSYYGGTVYTDTTEAFPQTITVTLDAAARLSRAVVQLDPIRNNSTAWLDFTCEVSPNGTDWTQVYAYDDTGQDYIKTFTSAEADCVVESFWSPKTTHLIDFTPQSVKAIRFTVNDVTQGGYYNTEMVTPHFTSLPKYNRVREIQLFDVPAAEVRTVLLLA